MKFKVLLVCLLLAFQTFSNKAKYIFLFIGDGMGMPQVASSEILESALKGGEPDAQRTLSFTKFPAQGITTTHDSSSFIPDSASTGTSIATGNKTLDGVIAMDTTKTIKYKSLAKMAKEQGMKVGIVSSVSINHATPAVFYANVPSRGMYYEIGLQLAESNFDYFAGGSAVDPDGKNSKLENKPGNLFSYARKNGYVVTNTVSAFNKLSKKNNQKVWAITEAPADGESMLYEIDRKSNQLSLADFTKKGIELLENPDGFFMMVEGGKIDWAGHANDAMALIKDIHAFDDSIKEALEFARKYPEETLIVVTGDHETGGMTIGFAGTKYTSFYEKLQNQRVSYVKFNEMLKEFFNKNPKAKFEQVMPLITDNFGLTDKESTNGLQLSAYEMKLLKEAFEEQLKAKAQRSKDEESYLSYGGYEPLTVKITHILNRKAGIGWTTYSHTGVPVQTYAYGVSNELFNGYYDNTVLHRKLASLIW